MPLYEYQCDACGRRFELIRKFSDPPLEICPHCGGHVQKLISSPAFQFKGTGWYVTDYSRKDKGGSSDSDRSGSTASGSSSGDKTGKESAEAGKSSGDGAKDSPKDSGKESTSTSKDSTPATTTPKS
jgi:putative FmdB family regulatory protein